jgi:hypothetical protein
MADGSKRNELELGHYDRLREPDWCGERPIIAGRQES